MTGHDPSPAHAGGRVTRDRGFPPQPSESRSRFERRPGAEPTYARGRWAPPMRRRNAVETATEREANTAATVSSADAFSSTAASSTDVELGEDGGDGEAAALQRKAGTWPMAVVGRCDAGGGTGKAGRQASERGYGSATTVLTAATVETAVVVGTAVATAAVWCPSRRLCPLPHPARCPPPTRAQRPL